MLSLKRLVSDICFQPTKFALKFDISIRIYTAVTDSFKRIVDNMFPDHVLNSSAPINFKIE